MLYEYYLCCKFLVTIYCEIDTEHNYIMGVKDRDKGVIFLMMLSIAKIKQCQW